MTDDGGNVVGSTIAQPIVNRSGLFMDSEITSKYGLSLVRKGRTLYTIPCKAKTHAVTNNVALPNHAQPRPRSVKAVHSNNTKLPRSARSTARRRDFVG